MSDDRYILVVADNSSEVHIALEYACARSKKTGRKIIIATFVEPIDVLTTQGVSEIMKNEARDEAEKKLKEAASFVKNKTGELPALSLREGEIISELKKLPILINAPPIATGIKILSRIQRTDFFKILEL